MKNTRRVFLTQLSVLTGSAVIGSPLLRSTKSSNYHNLLSPDGSFTIYHTNNVNGQTEAVHNGLGGLTRFNSLLKNEKQRGLVLDAGGFMSGSKSIYAQNQMVALMNASGYHAAGLSNQELACGEDRLAELASKMNFGLVNCNHEFKGDLKNVVTPYIIVTAGSLKIGITGVSEKLAGFNYNDPIQSANITAALLKKREGCDLVICLSHLQDPHTSNMELAAQSSYIDIIAGGGKNKTTGSILVLQNKIEQEVILASAGHKGLTAGKLTLGFNAAGQRFSTEGRNIAPGAPSNQRESVAIMYLNQLKNNPVEA